VSMYPWRCKWHADAPLSVCEEGEPGDASTASECAKTLCNVSPRDLIYAHVHAENTCTLKHCFS
jgi:hypothetical protein